MTTTITEFEIIEHLDFDFDPPCEMNEKCGKVATWKMTVSCCGKTILCCEPCKDMVMEWSKFGTMTHQTEMGGCGSVDVTIMICEKL